MLKSSYRDIRTATKDRLSRYLPPVLERTEEIPRDVQVVFLVGKADARLRTADIDKIRARCGEQAMLADLPSAAHVPHPRRIRRCTTK